jgi:hypothetical protein
VRLASANNGAAPTVCIILDDIYSEQHSSTQVVTSDDGVHPDHEDLQGDKPLSSPGDVQFRRDLAQLLVQEALHLDGTKSNTLIR